MTYLEQHTDDAEALFQGEASKGWEFEYLQLSPGPLGATVVMASLPDLSICWNRWSARVHAQECLCPGATHLGFLLNASGEVKWYGKALDRNDALLYLPSHEQDYLLPPDVQALGFTFSDKLRKEMGWKLEHVPLHHISQTAVNAVTTLATHITQRLRLAGKLELHESRILQERLALQLSDLLEPWLSRRGNRHDELSPSRQHRLTTLAISRLREFDYSEKPDIQALASELGVSSRSLHRAFRNCFGIGPYEYHTLMRLRAFRRSLRTCNGRHGAITEAAMAAGFTHLSRFSTLYRKQYGERPRDSLRRWISA